MEKPRTHLTCHQFRHPERLVLIYWGICAVLGALFLQDWIGAWNVGATLAQPWLLLVLVGTWIIGQAVYIGTADHQGRAFDLRSTIMFAVGNGVLETWAFALVYRLGELVGWWVAGVLVPAAASGTGFALGTLLLMVYNGPIHMLFWMNVLPPHFGNTPLAKALHRFVVPSLAAIVIGWCLCFWWNRDLWTVTVLHMLVDLVLMIRVRPALFRAGSPSTL